MVTACSQQSYHSRKQADSGSQMQSQVQAPRPLYRYSVVPGGVYSGEELRRVRGIDSVAAEHYAAIGPHLVAVSLSREANMYVSYRIQDRIYWTTQKRRIPKGEHVLTDGANLVRTRCGNRLSPIPMAPTKHLDEPPEAVFISPEPPFDAVLLSGANSPLPLPGPEAATPLDADLLQSGLSYIPSPLLLPPEFRSEGSSVPDSLSKGRGFWNTQSAPIAGNFGSIGVVSQAPPYPLVSIPEPAGGLLSAAGLVLISLLGFLRFREGPKIATVRSTG